MTHADELRLAAEKELGWEEGASNCFSLPTLRELIREKSPELHREMSLVIQLGEHLFEPIKKRRKHG